ncbi:hypothetical protein DYB32_007799 [Aphanomyces invadans]|uniref:EGF-like domain-containing protein n=1 Tax=Aphanomyces invadans TaxID=157072 RepID=A0A418AN01_9STRA|nr:hypothetical protein DYB32_007799 [Aphanomyces invadans]
MFTVSTYDAAGVLLEAASVAGTAISSNPALLAALSSNSTAGSNEPWKFMFTTLVTLPVGSILRATFPARYAVLSPIVLDTTGFGATTYTVSAVGNNVSIYINTFALVPGTYNYTLQGITNPGTSCNEFYDEACLTAWEDIIVSTLDMDAKVYQRVSLPGVPIIKSHLRFARVRTTATTPNTITSAYVLLNLMTPIPVGGSITATFPSGYDLNPSGSTIVAYNSGINGMSTAVISGQTLTITIAGTPVASQNGVRFTLNGVRTPPLHATGSYIVRTFDSYNNILEESANIGGVGCRFLNDCSGHGDCTLMSSTCVCHPGFGASTDVTDYKAPDCSLRTPTRHCPLRDFMCCA